MMSSDIPGCLSYTHEARIYDQALDEMAVHVEPHTTEVLGLFTAVTRVDALQDPEHPDACYEAAKAYADTMEETADVPDVDPETELDGGMPTPTMLHVLDAAATDADGRMSAEETLSYIQEEHPYDLSETDETAIDELADRAITAYRQRVMEDVWEAIPYDEEKAAQLADRYIDHVIATVNEDVLEDPVTGQEMPPDEALLRDIEQQIGVTPAQREDYRHTIVNWVSHRALQGERIDPLSNRSLRWAVIQRLWNGQQADKRERTLDALEAQGYSREMGEQLLAAVGEPEYLLPKDDQRVRDEDRADTVQTTRGKDRSQHIHEPVSATSTLEQTGITDLLSGVEQHLELKEENRLYRARTRIKTLTTDGMEIGPDASDEEDTAAVTVSPGTFEAFFAALRHDHDTVMEYGGTVSDDIETQVLDDILAENDVRPESMVAAGRDRQPTITATDTGNGIRYTGRMHLLTDIKPPLEEWVGDEAEHELQITATLPYDEATVHPETDTSADQAEKDRLADYV